MKPKPRMEKSEEIQDIFSRHFAQWHDDWFNMEGEGGSRITLRSSFKYLSGKSSEVWVWALPRTEFISVLLTLRTRSFLAVGGCSVHWRMFSRISGLYPPVDSNTNHPPPPPVVTTKNISRHCQYLPPTGWWVNHSKDRAPRYSQVLPDPLLNS